MMGQFSNSGPGGRMINAHSFVVASLARRLARGRAVLVGLDTFTPGILHDLGKLLQLEVDQRQYAALLEQAEPGANQLITLERAHLGYDHAELAAHVMTGRKLPEALVTVVRCTTTKRARRAKAKLSPKASRCCAWPTTSPTLWPATPQAETQVSKPPPPSIPLRCCSSVDLPLKSCGPSWYSSGSDRLKGRREPRRASLPRCGKQVETPRVLRGA
ncbi:MAG: hypothetical protein RJA70_1615 [Pseudomonadota bacterium]